MINFYDILGINADCDMQTVEDAYINRLQKNTMEDNINVDDFYIREAYEILSNTAARQEYDEQMTLDEELKLDIKSSYNFRYDNKFTKAIKIYENILKENDIRFIQISLSHTYIQNGNFQKAIKLIQTLLEKEPNNIDFLQSLANACYLRGWNKKGDEVLNKILALYPEKEESLFYTMATVHFSNKRFDLSLELLNKLTSKTDIDKYKLYNFIVVNYIGIINNTDYTRKDIDEGRYYLDRFSNILLSDPASNRPDCTNVITTAVLLLYRDDMENGTKILAELGTKLRNDNLKKMCNILNPDKSNPLMTTDMIGQKNVVNEQGTLKRTTVKVGRNDPCPCESGKKYKHCCGR